MKHIPIPKTLRSFMRVTRPEQDVPLLGNSMRKDDIRDLDAIRQALPDPRWTPAEMLARSVKNSFIAVTFFRPGSPQDIVGMGGVTPYGVVWTLFHKDFLRTQEDKAIFIKACPLVRDYFLAVNDAAPMGNVTLRSNRNIVRWLRWLGATFVPCTIAGQPFYSFIIKAKEGGKRV